MTRLPSGPRLTLAADLNDLITHRVAAVQVQAAAAERLLGATAGCGASTAIRAVRGLTAEAMDELRRLARLLDDGAPVSLSPMPSDVPGVESALPGGVAVCAYRCVELLAGQDLTFTVQDAWLEIRWRGELDGHREGSLRAFVKPCAGAVRRRGDAWSIRLPLEP
ncbi:histidine kinase [Solirubrobacter phytolaccae]|uniref:Histidine kinase n=1 Tax=Solirubrobacter phytolaccae TaxID=1404360 RepID=A0A9X3N8D2_9ACTN|nr:histidine kinase [Solirubrobacter phytolaccae]MDA0181673.1 histidine kinase [Solirubrobacter phytolaccae]